MTSFSTTSFGKWILAGEHSVLRGKPALAFPLLSQSFKLSFESTSSDLTVSFEGERGSDYRLLFHGVLEQALDRLKVRRDGLRGQVRIVSSLPVGSGLGASAALCVAMTRWFCFLKLISEDEVYTFARSLEDLFHGESSGVDIAVSMKGHGIHFVRNHGMKDLELAWKPNLYLSYCGSKGLTAECVNKVKALIDTHPEHGRQLDVQMNEAVDLAEQSLTQCYSPEREKDLKNALLLARDCFDKWGLVFGDLKDHIRKLEEAGALAVKPTGSGGGGYVLSLWPTGATADLSLIKAL
ncbi:MAG: hypothetical protein GW917_02070 [Bdellovibrionales bacterium]|nr:hypothetical protein [Bdellovibrionales bacterium]